MAQSDNPADPFKKALGEATKVMAEDSELEVSFSVDPPGQSEKAVRLPQVSRRMTRDEILMARGVADSIALRHRYHDAPTYNRYAPTGQMARDIYDALETARCEAIGARDMPGTATNVDVKIDADARNKGYDRITEAADAPLATAAGYLIRHLATGRDLPESASNVMNLWREFIEGQASETLDNLDTVLTDPGTFARFARQMIDDLGYGDQLGDDPDAEDDDGNPEGEDAPEQEEAPDDPSGDQDQTDEFDAAPDESQEAQDDPSEASVSMDDMSDMEFGDDTELPDGEAPL
ncbi:MAG: cobaltochelatase subunit CobT, partial [Pseudomonadota bacterium]